MQRSCGFCFQFRTRKGQRNHNRRLSERRLEMIIGFGATETAFEDAQGEAFKDFVTKRFDELALDYFTTEFVNEVRIWLDAQGEQFRILAETYAKAENHPDRYSSFYPALTDSASDMVAILRFHHINRRHGMSPDGWALLQSERLFNIRSTDLTFERSQRRAA